MCHSRLLIINGMIAKILPPLCEFFYVGTKGDVMIRSKGILDIRLIKMVSKTMLVSMNGVIIMNGVWNIWDSRTTLGWGAGMEATIKYYLVSGGRPNMGKRC
jgi:hypothetical protein